MKERLRKREEKETERAEDQNLLELKKMHGGECRNKLETHQKRSKI